MKNKMITTLSIMMLALLLLGAGNIFAMGNGNSDSISDYTGYDGLHSLIKDDITGYVLVDVRTIEEYSAGHIPTAINIPYDVIALNFPAEKKDDLIVVYCRSGRRSGIAKQTLLDLGYTNIYDFGAFSKWEENFIQGQNPGNL